MTGLPAGWTSTTLKAICSKIVDGSHNPPKAVAAGKPMLSARNVRDRAIYLDDFRFISDYDFEQEHARTQIEGGDVLLTIVGAIGRTAVVPSGAPAFALQRSVAVLRPIAMEPRALAYALEAPDVQKYMTENARGTAQKGIYLGTLATVEVKLPPAEEQQRIADKLDTVLARVDACRDRLARVVPLLRRFRQAVLAAATSGRLTQDWRGEGTPDWVNLRADDVCTKVQSGGTPKAGFTETTGVPFLKVYNIVNQQIDFEYRPQFVHPDVHAGELGKSRTLPGDVLMNIVGPPLGKVAVVTNAAAEWNINQAITLFRPGERITSGWLYVLLCEGAAVRSVLDRTKGSVGQVNISLSQCRAFEFPVPTIQEQNEAVRRVETLFAFADRLDARLAQARSAVDRLTPSLLAKAFRGELVPQDPADEPAAELLKRLAVQRGAEPARQRRQRAAT